MSVDPIYLANAHQQSIVSKRQAIQADADCIRQLLVGRDVQRRDRDRPARFRVTEARMTLTGTVEIRGKRDNKGRASYIGLIAQIELAP